MQEEQMLEFFPNDDSDDDNYESLPGFHGQTVLTHKKSYGVLSRFSFRVQPPPTARRDGRGAPQSPPGAPLTLDGDGDPEVPRRRASTQTLLIEHQQSTTLALVGEQVWRGALYLADYLLCVDRRGGPPLVRGRHVLELAAGVGLTSLVAATAAASVTVTDLDRGNILALIRRNIDRNKDLLQADMAVAELDFSAPRTVAALGARLREVSLLLAADVVYDNRITDAFFATVRDVMSQPPDKTLLIALEKRYVFTTEDLDTVAPCYEHFLERLYEMTRGGGTGGVRWTAQEVKPEEIPQSFDYERTRHLVLWRICAQLPR